MAEGSKEFEVTNVYTGNKFTATMDKTGELMLTDTPVQEEDKLMLIKGITQIKADLEQGHNIIADYVKFSIDMWVKFCSIMEISTTYDRFNQPTYMGLTVILVPNAREGFMEVGKSKMRRVPEPIGSLPGYKPMTIFNPPEITRKSIENITG